MEYLIALLAALVTTATAVFIAVNIEKGKPWALEMAQTISLLSPNALAAPHLLREADGRGESLNGAEQAEKSPHLDPEERLAA